MSNYRILRKSILSTQNQPTEKTQHFRGEEKIAVPDSLQIVKYPDDVGYYLLYLDKEGNELTDTYHDQLEDALAQAEWEFSVSPEQWEILEEDNNTSTQADLNHKGNHIKSGSDILAERLREKLRNSSR